MCFDLPLSSLQRARPHETGRHIRYLGGGCSSCKLGCVSGGAGRQVGLAASFGLSAVTLLANCSARRPLRIPAILANLLVHSALDREESQKNQPARRCIHNTSYFGSRWSQQQRARCNNSGANYPFSTGRARREYGTSTQPPRLKIGKTEAESGHRMKLFRGGGIGSVPAWMAV